MIGSRHYTGYLHNISLAGARLRTISRIGKLGPVMLRLPDLRPLRCRLRWIEAHHAGVSFEMMLTRTELLQWVQSRSEFDRLGVSTDCEILYLRDLEDESSHDGCRGEASRPSARASRHRQVQRWDGGGSLVF